MFTIDIQTVLFSYLIINAICTAVVISLWLQNHRRSPELSFWLADYLMQFAAVLLLALLRGTLPDIVSNLLGTPLTLTGTLLLYIGLERYLGKRSPHVFVN